MKKAQFHNKSKTELVQLLRDKQISLGKLRFELVDKKLKDVSQLKKTRHDIARIMTQLRDHTGQ